VSSNLDMRTPATSRPLEREFGAPMAHDNQPTHHPPFIASPTRIRVGRTS
jgi:hypothetical protein